MPTMRALTVSLDSVAHICRANQVGHFAALYTVHDLKVVDIADLRFELRLKRF